MKKALIMLACTLFSLSMVAQEAKKAKKAPTSGERGMFPIEIQELETSLQTEFTKLDVNESGFIERDEMKKMNRLGENRRGGLSPEDAETREVAREERRARREKMVDQMLESMDTDANGSVSAEEFAAMRVEPMKRMDADEDGTVTREEVRAFRQARRGF